MNTKTTKTASEIQVGDVIRRYAPYRYWLDYQAVTKIERNGRAYIITREDGGRQGVRGAARFEVQ